MCPRGSHRRRRKGEELLKAFENDCGEDRDDEDKDEDDTAAGTVVVVAATAVVVISGHLWPPEAWPH